MDQSTRETMHPGLGVVAVATDFSARSDRAVRRAALIARDAGARLVLVHVVDDDQPEHIVAAECEIAETALADAIREHAHLAGLRCVPLVVCGTPFDGILQAARQQGADLCVIGSHRRAFLKDIFVGTTAERVIRNSPIPVLMANIDPALRYATGLAPVELSDVSVQALSVARQLGLLPRSRVSILHVYDAAAAGMLSYAGVRKSNVDDYLVEIRVEAVRELVRFLDPIDLGDLDYSTIVKEGIAPAVIVDVAGELRPDLVVIGTHGRQGAIRLLLGSVTEEVLRRLRQDILVVPVRDA
ncbi:MAG: universal stress protein [Rhodopseudomonas palustris]|uniref:Universal stress protein n=1 Tax=Rhodopseudomonas palustris TaxID=1076 RepID=A0A933RTM8_RHOPL|nr:universal stress protein [Rhodopseudomonas palustris]